jgi:hypothetical protein
VLSSRAGQRIAVVFKDRVSGMANRALGHRRIGVDLNAHCSFALNGASEVVGEIVAVEVANKENAPKAGIRSGSVREVSGYAVSFDETASVEGTTHTIGVPHANIGEDDVDGRNRDSVIINGVACTESARHSTNEYSVE